MTQLSGVISLLFVAAAFLSSCNPQPPAGDGIYLPSFSIAE